MLLPDPLSRDMLDFQLSPSRSAKDAMGVLARHQRETEALDQKGSVSVLRDVPYGPGARQRMDVCRPIGRSAVPCLVFIHGGFWQEGSKAGSGFAAASWAAEGRAHVGLGYTLTPQVRLHDIVTEIATALVHLRQTAPGLGIDPDRIVVAGHSAGAHLVAAILSGMGGETAAKAVAGAVLISGVYELAPIAASYVNDAVGMDSDEVADLSPLRFGPCCDVPTHIVVGGDETDAFQWQSDMLYRVWTPELSRLGLSRLAGRDHFDVLDTLADPDSPTFEFIRKITQ